MSSVTENVILSFRTTESRMRIAPPPPKTVELRPSRPVRRPPGATPAHTRTLGTAKPHSSFLEPVLVPMLVPMLVLVCGELGTWYCQY